MTPGRSVSNEQPQAFGRGDISLLDADGRVICTELPRLHTVGIADLAQVVDHRINAIMDSIAHYVRFRSGGELYYVFNGRGQLVELSAKALRFTISAKGDYLFRQL